MRLRSAYLFYQQAQKSLGLTELFAVQNLELTFSLISTYFMRANGWTASTMSLRLSVRRANSSRGK